MSDQARAELAPSGVLRAGINMANALLVTGRTEDGDPDGVSPDLARGGSAPRPVNNRPGNYDQVSAVQSSAARSWRSPRARGARGHPLSAYTPKDCVVDLACGSVTTLMTAGFPDAKARSRAGRSCSGLSTYSPCVPSASPSLS